MKWSRYNVLFYSEKLGYALFNSRMLSLTTIDKDTYDLFCEIRDGVVDAESNITAEDLDNLKKGKVLVLSLIHI